MLIGLRRDTGHGHIARAALEAIAFQVADVLERWAATRVRRSRPLESMAAPQ